MPSLSSLNHGNLTDARVHYQGHTDGNRPVDANVLEAQKWTAQEWARQAYTSATNITRALGPHGPMRTAATLAKLVAVAGSHPDFSGGKRDAQGMFFSVPLLHGTEVDKLVGKMGTETQEAWLTARALEGPVVATLYRPSDRAFAVRIDVASLTGRGIFPQDTVIVEPNDILPLEAGCIVVVRSEGQTGADRVPAALPAAACERDHDGPDHDRQRHHRRPRRPPSAQPVSQETRWPALGARGFSWLAELHNCS